MEVCVDGDKLHLGGFAFPSWRFVSLQVQMQPLALNGHADERGDPPPTAPSQSSRVGFLLLSGLNSNSEMEPDGCWELLEWKLDLADKSHNSLEL